MGRHISLRRVRVVSSAAGVKCEWPEAIRKASKSTTLVDAAWLAKLADENGVLPRCQDVPAEAKVDLDKHMHKWTDNYTLPILVISYPWLDADHPDIDGAQLRRLAFVVKAFANKAGEKEGGKCGVFWDYCSCAAASIKPAPTSFACRLSPALALSCAGCRSAPWRPTARARRARRRRGRRPRRRARTRPRRSWRPRRPSTARTTARRAGAARAPARARAPAPHAAERALTHRGATAQTPGRMQHPERRASGRGDV